MITVFKSILAPIDFSPHSAQALRLAANIARQNSAMLTLVNVLDPLDYAVAEGESWPTERRQASFSESERSLAKAKAEAESIGAPFVQTQAIEGGVTASIFDLATRIGADLIVIGTHGRTGLGRAVLGSIAEAVVRKAPCPVLTVKLGRGQETR